MIAWRGCGVFTLGNVQNLTDLSALEDPALNGRIEIAGLNRCLLNQSLIL